MSSTSVSCRIMVDKRIQLKFVDFFAKQNEMVEPTCEKLKHWEQHGHKVDVIRMDNGGENIKLEKPANSRDWKLGIEFEKQVVTLPNRIPWLKLHEQQFQTVLKQ
jgi:hypothetical protein